MPIHAALFPPCRRATARALATALLLALAAAAAPAQAQGQVQVQVQVQDETGETVRDLDDAAADTTVAGLSREDAQRLLDTAPPEDPAAAFALLVQQERAARRVGDRARHLAVLRRLVEGATGHPDRERWRLWLVNAEHAFGSQQRAAELAEQAATDGTLSEELRALMHLRAAFFYLQANDRLRGTKAWSRSEAPVRQALADPALRDPALMQIYYRTARAELERMRGDLNGSVNSLREAVVIARRALTAAQQRSAADPGSDAPTAMRAEHEGALALLSYALVRVSRNAEAAAVAEEALRIAQVERRGANSVARWHYRLANVQLAQHDYVKALRNATAAEEQLVAAGAEGTSSALWLARRERVLGLLALRRFEEADRAYREALYAMGADGVARNRANDAKLQAILAAKNGRINDAMTGIEASLKYRSRLYGERHPQTQEARGVRGFVHLVAGNLRLAQLDYEDLFAATLDTPSGWLDLGLGGFRGFTLAIAFDEYLNVVADAARRGEADPKMVDRALQLADRMSLTVTQEALIDSTARVLAVQPELQQALGEEQTQRQKLRALYGELSGALSRESPAKLKELPEAERKALRADLKTRREAIDAEQLKLTALRDGIAKRFPAYADLATPGTPAPDALRKLLGAGEVLVMLYPGERGTLVWALAAEGRTALHASPLTAAQLAGRVAEARRMLDLGAAGRTPPPLQPELLHALYRDLLGPLEPVLANARTLIVATQGPLGSLPFAALVAAPPQAGAPVAWLARRMAVVQVPTASSLLALRRSPPAPAARALIGFGDPMFDPARGAAVPAAIRRLALARDPSAALAAGPAAGPASAAATGVAAGATPVAASARPMPANAPAARSAPAAPARNLASFDIETGFRYEDMPPLPETRAELLALVAALSGDAKTDLFLGERATRRAVIDAPLLDRRVVAFATHGLMPGEVPGVSKPALALAGVAADSGESPLLTLDDVLALRLNAQWVVLSACNTAAGDADGGAMSGLVRGFFFAGARSVLATHWAVESASAEALVSTTFRQATRDAAGRAQALREAQLAMIDGRLGDGRWTHPFYWAPYALFGDPAR